MQTHESQAKQLSLVAKVGDPVQIAAPKNSMGALFNNSFGSIFEFGVGGWITVDLEGFGKRRFRADELRLL